MTDSDSVAICLVIDRSGSMRRIQSDAEGGINAFLDEQRSSTGKRTVRIVTFDDRYEVLTETCPISEVQPFKLMPRGMTALHDAMGRAISEFGEELANLSEVDRPGSVIVVVMTDGLENASKEWTAEQVKSLVEHQREVYKWTILFLGANQDAVLTAESLGVPSGHSLTYAASSAGVASATRSMSKLVTNVSRGGSAAFSEKDRKDADRNL